MHKYGKYSYRLQFFAKEGAGGEKTEEPTTKKLSDARKEGQVARSQELITAASLLSLFLVLKVFSGYLGNRFIESFQGTYKKIELVSGEEFHTGIATTLINDALLDIILISLPVFVSAFIVSFVVSVFQVKWQITGKPLMPKFSKINPISGFKKIFSMDKLVELLKSVLKIAIITIIVYNTLTKEIGKIEILYELGNLSTAIMLIGATVIDLGLQISLVFLIIGLADLIYQKIKFKKDMRMSKQEIKDEFKQSEGDPQIKGRIRQKMREASQRRMMQQLPQADVVITNPTHYACALKYDKETAGAPILIAKGADHLAGKIKDIAKEYKIPIVENKPLARMLYFNVDLDKEIPQELYQMTAEVIAYVYSLKNNIA